MPLTLQLTDDSPIPIDASLLSPSSIAMMSPDKVARLPIQRGREKIECGELFRVSGIAVEDQTIRLEEVRPSMHCIGAELSEGTIQVCGSVGIGLADRMSGGEIVVEGDVGDGAAREMSGGRLIVRGNVGDRLAGAAAGSVRGMTGGDILVTGNVGDQAAERMRRGTIVIQGDCGDATANGMIAGTIVIGGNIGKYPGVNMKRGTIIVHGKRPIRLLPTFGESTTHPPDFLRLLSHMLGDALRSLPSSSVPAFRNLIEAPIPSQIQSWRGDQLALGLGEIYQLRTV